MTHRVKLSAFWVANQFDLKGIKAFLDIKPLADSSSELFYGFAGEKFQYYFNFGVLVLSGYTEDEMKWAIKTVHNFQRDPSENWMRDDHAINVAADSDIVFGFDELTVAKVDAQVIRISMFNLAQSVALDHYHEVSENLLTEVKGFTDQLEHTGKLKISRSNMRRFLGRALNTQIDIAENIYIFDAPDLVWYDDYLDKLHQGLMKHFDLRVRFSEVEYTMRIIAENLAAFREIIHQRESNFLEYIIIALIFVEVLDLIIAKLL
ncbi:MAG TPA: RMD1 family protein [Cellvibrionaceae bacterium]|nr:RMD1 family protein [Cellvibrionaceae bacterium]HMW72357.1 RMD1 family protein [Cellvibrionaceae bacterium]HMY37860.1 RMD1 family protein [Marinagarivorans sp.]HNG61310.1 RMD1 family protein [Cellvibrionaceae bacterium]